MTTARNVCLVHPWDYPAVDLPERVTPKWVGEVTASQIGDAYIAAHLVPARQDKQYKAAWRTFWRALSFNDRRPRRIVATLAGWRDEAEAELTSGDLSEEQSSVQRKFRSNVNGALDRIDRESGEALAWAGVEFAKYPPEMRAMLETLVVALDEFRQGRLQADEVVTTLAVVDLDPRDRSVQIPDATHQWVRNEIAKVAGD